MIVLRIGRVDTHMHTQGVRGEMERERRDSSNVLILVCAYEKIDINRYFSVNGCLKEELISLSN